MSGPDTLVERLLACGQANYTCDSKVYELCCEAAAELSALRERCETAERNLGRVEAERDAAEFAARNGRSLSEDSIHAIRELLNEAGVPKAAFIDDHVGNAVVQRNQAEAARDAAVAALEPFAKLADQIDAWGHGDDSTCEHRLKASDIRRARATQPAGKEKGDG